MPSDDVAYHSGGLYEVLIGFVSFAIAMALRGRLRAHPTAMIWLVMASLALGRFIGFFARSDSAAIALGLETAQWTSVALMLVAVRGTRSGATGGRRTDEATLERNRAAHRIVPPKRGLTSV